MKISKSLPDAKSAPAQYSDREIWLEVKAGSSIAFEYLYKTYVQRLYKYGLHLVNDEAIVEDVVHDVFVNIWVSRQQLKSINSIKAYLLSSVKYGILHYNRRHTKSALNKHEIVNKLVLEHTPSYESQLIDSEHEKQMIQFIRNEINKLTGRQKEIIYLKYYQNLNYDEISEILEIDKNYIYNIVSKAFETIRSHLPVINILMLAQIFASANH